MAGVEKGKGTPPPAAADAEAWDNRGVEGGTAAAGASWRYI